MLQVSAYFCSMKFIHVFDRQIDSNIESRNLINKVKTIYPKKINTTRFYIIFILINIFSFPVFAQTSASALTGFLRLKSGKPISFATVVVKDLGKHDITDEKGRFDFSEVKYGKYEIEVFSIEIQRKVFEVELTKDSKPIILIVEPSDIDLNEVVVIANSQKKEIETKGFAVNVIETQKIATQSIQVNELLDRTAGVRVRQDGGLGSQIRYNINGLSGDAIKIFIDGTPASNFGSSFSLNSIPPSLIERIEVYKGVVPGYLSEDALGGAINIILKQRRKNSLTTSYSVGSFNTHQWNATGSYRWDNGLTFDGSTFYNYSDNNYKVWGDDIYFVNYQGTITESNGKKVKRFHDAYESLGGRFNFGFTDVKWADKFLIGGVFSKDYREVQNGITMRTVYGDRHTRRNSAVLTMSYDKSDFLLEGLSLKVDASHSSLKRQAIDTVGIMHDWAGPIRFPDGSYVKYNSGAEIGNAKTASINRDYVNMVRANLSYKINDNHTFYTNYLFNDFKRKASDVYQPIALQKLRDTRDLQKNMLSFTYENVAFAGKLRTNIFYKHYFQKVVSNEPYLENKEYKVNRIQKKIDYSGYGLTVSYALLPNLYLLGSAEKALRLPNADELFGNVADNLLPPSSGLEPERSFNANLGVNFGPFIIDNHSFSLNTSVYYRDTEGMIREAIRSGSFVYSQFENLEDVLSKGIDAELNYNYGDKVNFRFNISKFDVLFNTKHDKKGDPYQYYRMQIRNEPSFKFNSNISYFHNNLFLKNSRASVYYNINYVEGFLRNWSNVGSANLSRIPTQYPMDLGATYTFPKNKIVLSFDAKNIFDKQIYDNFGLQKPGRAFYAKVTYFIL